MECRLIQVSDGVNQSYFLKEGITNIGRDLDNEIQLSSADVSRHHARIYNMGDVVEIEDLNSANGTYVNGKKITRVILSHGNEIKIGRIYFFFEENSSVGMDDNSGTRDYSTRVKNETIRTKMNHDENLQNKSGDKVIRPVRPLKPFQQTPPDKGKK